MPVTNRTQSTDWSRIQQGQGKLQKGAKDAGSDGSVHQLQTKLNGWLKANGKAELAVDGKFGGKTESALKDFQKANGLSRDGVFGKDTFSKLADPSAPPPRREPSVDAIDTPRTNANPNEGVAKFERTYNTGKTNQGKEGKITVNGHTYDFVSGGQNRGNLPPGEYKVEKWQPKGATQHVDGFGYSYRLLKKQDGKWIDAGIKDPRLGVNDRSYFRIHPDGGGKGTWGCIGISGNKATQQAFKRDMDAALAQAAREGRPYTFQVG